jgi:lysylphosphatidylglycerol synthetase-like protein (DUF2156 family)
MLTSEQVDMIGIYCETRSVGYYDVQLELVDHIADIIEQLQKENPQLAFKEALELAGSRFSKAEFDAIVASKRNQLLARFMRLWRKEFYAYFTIPKIAITLLLIAVTVWVTQINHLEKFPGFAIHMLNLINFACVFGRSKIIIEIKEERQKSLLVYKILNRRQILVAIPSVFYLVLSLWDLTSPLPANKWLLEAALYLFPLFVLICLAWRKMYVDQLILIKENYPNAFAS